MTQEAPSRPRRIIPRGEAFAAAGWSRTTGLRREKSDPRIPQRVQIGPGRYGFVADEWDAYIAGFQRVDAAVARPTPLAAFAKIGAAASVASRRAKASLTLAAEDRGAKSPGVGAPTADDTPADTPERAAA